MLMHEGLKWSGSRPHQRPKLRFHPDAEYSIGTIPSLTFDKNNPEDVDTDGNDHAYDALTYALLFRIPKGWQETLPTFDHNIHPGMRADGTRRPYPGTENPATERARQLEKMVRESEGRLWGYGYQAGEGAELVDVSHEDVL
jgi:hypothetical protein